ncbi:hypothetical protein GCM10023080_057390 [Streptomyces pseudoechinosporeus]
MEQRIGPSIQPLQGAAADPAFVPGITGPRPADPKDDKDPVEEIAADEENASEETETAADAGQADDVSDEDASAESDEVDQSDEAEVAAESDEAADSDESDDSEAAGPGGPVFEASDYRAKITADHRGVRLRLDDHEAEFRWDEIGAVESETSRFGRWYTITVHTPERRWYPVELRVPSRAKVKEWEKELDEVLDAYFQE